jgi:hypothetical protein
MAIEAPAFPKAQGFDLARLKPPPTSRHRSCAASASADEIVVCATDPEKFRLRPLPDTYERPGSGKAELGLGSGITGALRAEARQLGGAISNRVMVDIKLGF